MRPNGYPQSRTKGLQEHESRLASNSAAAFVSFGDYAIDAGPLRLLPFVKGDHFAIQPSAMPAQGDHRTDGVGKVAAIATDNDEINGDFALGEKSR